MRYLLPICALLTFAPNQALTQGLGCGIECAASVVSFHQGLAANPSGPIPAELSDPTKALGGPSSGASSSVALGIGGSIGCASVSNAPAISATQDTNVDLDSLFNTTASSVRASLSRSDWKQINQLANRDAQISKENAVLLQQVPGENFVCGSLG